MSQEAELTPIRKAAAEFGVGVTTLYRWIAEGKLTRYERSAGRERAFVDRRELRKLLEPRPARKRKG